MMGFVFLAGTIFFAWMHYWIFLIAWLVIFGVILYKTASSEED